MIENQSKYPHNPDAEAGFLGCVLTSEGSALDEHPVTPEHFFGSANRLIGAACISLFDAKVPVNPMSVTDHLRSAGALERVGGPYAISSLFGSQSLTAHYHGVLCGQLALRRAVDAARWALNGWTNTDTAEAYLSEFRERLQGIDVSSDEENEVPVAVEAIGRRLDAMDRGDKITGFQTSNHAWNAAFGGLVPGAYYALAGRPGTGKSAMMESLACDLISLDHPVVVFQRDMSPQKMVERICCRWVGIPYWRYVRAQLNLAERAKIREVAKELANTPLYIYNPVGLTAEKLCAILRREKRVHGVKAAFLDHIQALKVGKDFREGLTQASLAIRGCVTELGIPLVTLCHLNREGGKGSRPSASNIKEFDQLYGDVDGMAILWSDSNPDDRQPGQRTEVNFYVAKNRDGPETEEKVWFNGELLQFEGLVKS